MFRQVYVPRLNQVTAVTGSEGKNRRTPTQWHSCHSLTTPFFDAYFLISALIILDMMCWPCLSYASIISSPSFAPTVKLFGHPGRNILCQEKIYRNPHSDEEFMKKWRENPVPYAFIELVRQGTLQRVKMEAKKVQKSGSLEGFLKKTFLISG